MPQGACAVFCRTCFTIFSGLLYEWVTCPQCHGPVNPVRSQEQLIDPFGAQTEKED